MTPRPNVCYDGVITRGASMANGDTQTTLYGFETLAPDLRRSDGRKTYNIKQLWQRSHEILNLASLGYNNLEIAEIVNVDPQTVSNTINSDLGKNKISELRFGRDEEVKKTHEKIRVLTSKALQVYHQIFDDDSGECNLKDKKAAADTVVLELSGLRAPTKVQGHYVHTELTAEELERFKARGTKAIKGTGIVIDVEPESETD